MLGVTIRHHGAVPPAGALLAAIMFRGSTLWQSARKCPCLLLPSMRSKHSYSGNWRICSAPYTLSARAVATLDNRDTMKERLVTGDRLVLFAEMPQAMARVLAV